MNEHVRDYCWTCNHCHYLDEPHLCAECEVAHVANDGSECQWYCSVCDDYTDHQTWDCDYRMECEDCGGTMHEVDSHYSTVFDRYLCESCYNDEEDSREEDCGSLCYDHGRGGMHEDDPTFECGVCWCDLSSQPTHRTVPILTQPDPLRVFAFLMQYGQPQIASVLSMYTSH